jgi:hypothetical protein
MRRFLVVVSILFAARGASGQEANLLEMDTINQIAQCLVAGLPDDWVAAHMRVQLATPGATRGGVSYLVARKDAEDKLEPFTPCDTDEPANLLIGLRATQARERTGWTVARLVVERDGNFRLNYEFPK